MREQNRRNARQPANAHRRVLGSRSFSSLYYYLSFHFSGLLHVFCLSLFLFSTACAGEYYQKLYSNRVASLFCKFSYNLYLWHQMIAVWLKEKRIPYWSGDTPPNMTGDRVWQWKYQILIIVVSAAVAVAVTLIVEIPAARYLLKDRDSHKEEGKQHDRI
jgi:peptidoglycan/LPS O-acetylase OafA/YrhL